METIKRFMVRFALPALCGTLAVGAFIALGIQHNFNRGDWAASVQAVGSVAALGIAVYVMARQNAHSRKLIADMDKRALLRKAAGLAAVIDRTNLIVGRMCDALIDTVERDDIQKLQHDAPEYIDMLRELKSNLVAIPTYEIGSYEISSRVFKIISVVDAFEATLEKTRPWAPRTMPYGEWITGAMNTKAMVEVCVENMHTDINELKTSEFL